MATVTTGTMSPKRRARLARTCFTLSLAALLTAGFLSSQSATATDEVLKTNPAFSYVSVLPGESLWDLAETYSEGKNVQDWIAEVMLLNNLASPELTAGDKLAIP